MSRRGRRWRTLAHAASFVVGVFVSLGGALAQDADGPGAKGLVFRVQGVGDDAAKVDARHARTLALHVPTDEPVSPLFAVGEAFRAEWIGSLRVRDRDRYTFTFEGVGTFTLSIDGEVLLEAQVAAGSGRAVSGDAKRLRSGLHALEATYLPVPGVAAEARLSWASRRFAREPIPPTAFEHDPADADLVAGQLARAGRSLLTNRRCVACHTDPRRGAADSVTEFTMAGPDLKGAGLRLEPDWMAAWIRDPRGLRPDARMPSLLGDDPDLAARDARDLAAFLAAETDLDTWTGPTDAADAAAGGVLYSELGCVACHQLGAEPAHDSADGPAPLDLRGVAHKFRPGALAAFLADPRRHDPWIRMPDFELSPTEAVSLEAFLRERAAPARPAGVADGDAARGRERFVALGCVSCHAGTAADAPGVLDAGATSDAAASRAPLLREVLAGGAVGGCMDPATAGRGGVPDFGLTDAERTAIRAAADADLVFARGPAAEFAARALTERRCAACHILDDRPSDWTRRAPLLKALGLPVEPAARAGEVLVAQNRPDLTRAGAKLKPEWIRAFLEGTVQPRPRPWLRARMPTYPQIADGIAQGLASMHGHPPRTPAEPEPSLEQVELGRRLVGTQGGFACITCHAVGDKAPLALFEVQGINLDRSWDRLRREYYLRWMLDPIRLDPSSRMPKYADENGKTGFVDVLDGDAEAQFAAIWAYLRSIH